MEPPGNQRSMTLLDPKMIFSNFLPLKIINGHSNHRNVFYLSQGTRWTLKFCSSSVRSKVIGDHGFSSFSALDLTLEVTGWPRTLSLYINLFVSRRATRSFFPRGSCSIRGETAKGGDRTNTPQCRGRMRNGLCRRGLRLWLYFLNGTRYLYQASDTLHSLASFLQFLLDDKQNFVFILAWAVRK